MFPVVLVLLEGRAAGARIPRTPYISPIKYELPAYIPSRLVLEIIRVVIPRHTLQATWHSKMARWLAFFLADREKSLKTAYALEHLMFVGLASYVAH